MKNSMHRYRKTFKFQSHHNWNWFSFFQNDSLWLKIFNILRHNWWIIFVVHPGSDYSLQTQTLNRQKEYWGMRMQIHFQTVSAAEMVCNMLNTRQSSKSVKKKKEREEVTMRILMYRTKIYLRLAWNKRESIWIIEDVVSHCIRGKNYEFCDVIYEICL